MGQDRHGNDQAALLTSLGRACGPNTKLVLNLGPLDIQSLGDVARTKHSTMSRYGCYGQSPEILRRGSPMNIGSAEKAFSQSFLQSHLWPAEFLVDFISIHLVM